MPHQSFGLIGVRFSFGHFCNITKIFRHVLKITRIFWPGVFITHFYGLQTNAIISDMSGEQTSKDLRKFCAEISTTLKFFEEGTLWSNKAELYIGLIKEALVPFLYHQNSSSFRTRGAAKKTTKSPILGIFLQNCVDKR